MFHKKGEYLILLHWGPAGQRPRRPQLFKIASEYFICRDGLPAGFSAFVNVARGYSDIAGDTISRWLDSKIFKFTIMRSVTQS